MDCQHCHNPHVLIFVQFERFVFEDFFALLTVGNWKTLDPQHFFPAQTIYGKGVPVSYDSLSSNAVALSSLGKNSISTLLVISQYRMTIEITNLKKRLDRASILGKCFSQIQAVAILLGPRPCGAEYMKL